jgi:hypothetical protein
MQRSQSAVLSWSGVHWSHLAPVHELLQPQLQLPAKPLTVLAPREQSMAIVQKRSQFG